ncbi:MAG: hypothetical protein E4H28_02880 [Gemmatimonadales bacterium]|nr:MAG: hypothetical protein E4H28_02880 [Gemmatimonadales bacterium]
MDMKKLMTGAVVGGIVMMGLGYLIWEVLFANYFSAWDSGNDMIWWSAAAGSVVLAMLLTMWLDKSGAKAWMDAAKSGAILGFTLWLGLNLLFNAWDGGANLMLHLTDSVLEAVRWGITGAAIAMVSGSKAATSDH